MSEPLPVETKSTTAEVGNLTAIAKEHEPPLFSSGWWSKQITLSTIVSIIALMATTTIGIQQMEMSQKMKDSKERKSLHDIQESAKKHEDHYVKQVKQHLSSPYTMVHDRVSDIPGLVFIARDEARTEALQNLMASSGGLTLLEGPSGCGKTTSVQHCLADMRTPGVYFSVRDDASGLAPLAAFVQSFGVTDLPVDMSSKGLDIVRVALEGRKREQKVTTPPPVLVIDDVQQLLKPPLCDEGGHKILQWCLGRAAMGELTVLFVSSETVQHLMRQLSGYNARLSTPDTPFEYISAATLKMALNAIKTPTSFKSEEIEKVVDVIGTHMTDVRSVQRLRTERGLTVEDALSELVHGEARALKGILFEHSTPSSNEEKLRSLVACYLCEAVASDHGGRPVSLSELEKTVKTKLREKLAEPFRSALKGTFVADVVAVLVARNVLRRFFAKGKIDEDIAFYRPVQRFAFKELRSSAQFQQMRTDVEGELFDDTTRNDMLE